MQEVLIPSKQAIEVPEYLVRETIQGQPFYYRFYKDVLNQQKTVEEIMGSSGLQSYVVATIVEFLNANIDRKMYKVLFNELGLHLAHKENISADIAIYEKTKIKGKLTEKYLDIPPKISIEVDVKIEHPSISTQEYVHLKTQELLDFGAEQVVWIFTATRKVLVAKNQQDWITKDWHKEIQIIDSVFSVEQILKEDGLL